MIIDWRGVAGKTIIMYQGEIVESGETPGCFAKILRRNTVRI